MYPTQIGQPKINSFSKIDESFYQGPSWNVIQGDWKLDEESKFNAKEAVTSHMPCIWGFTIKLSLLSADLAQ